MLCSSFSKTAGPGLRVGWVHGGRFATRLSLLKSLTTGSTATLPQLALARFLESGGYFRHVRRLRSWLEGQVQLYALEIAKAFSGNVRVSRPAGGHLLWVQLPPECDGDRLAARAATEQISLMPGSLFAAGRSYRNYIRINCGHTLTSSIAQGLRTIGRLAQTRASVSGT